MHSYSHTAYNLRRKLGNNEVNINTVLDATKLQYILGEHKFKYGNMSVLLSVEEEWHFHWIWVLDASILGATSEMHS